MNKQEIIKEIKKDLPETMEKALARKVKNSNREDFDIAEAMEDIINNQINLYNYFKRNERFREKFSEIMFERYLEENDIEFSTKEN